MEQHVVPRQITTFEFKLIGILTLRQFLYLLVFFPLAYISFYVFPIPFLRFVIAAIIAGVGVALAFVTIRDRPIDIWIKNFWKRLNSPTQYVYKKEHEAHPILEGLTLKHDPRITQYHIQAKTYLTNYMKKTPASQAAGAMEGEHIDVVKSLLSKQLGLVVSAGKLSTPLNYQPLTPAQLGMHEPAPAKIEEPAKAPPAPVASKKHTAATVKAQSPSPKPHVDMHTPGLPLFEGKQPYFMGIVKNNADVVLPKVMVYLKTKNGETKRIMKTNDNGIFATLSPLEKGEYELECKDPTGTYNFATMNVVIDPAAEYVREIFSVN